MTQPPPPDDLSSDPDSTRDDDAKPTDHDARAAHGDAEPKARWEEPSPGGAHWEEPRPGGEGHDAGRGSERYGAAPGGERPGGERGGERHGADDGGEGRPHHRVEENLKSKSTWLRLVFIVLFAIAWAIAELVLTAVVVIQFLWVLFDGAPNERLRVFGQSLARYAYQIFRYMTFNSDARPFPIDLDWPSGAPDPTSS